MTPDKFIESLVDAYRAARMPVQPHPKLSRGESRAIASETEDRFAYYLIGRLKNADHIFINQTITSVSNGAKERIKPDIVIYRGEEIRVLIDLKMDLGYKRTVFSESMKEVDKLISELRGHKFSLWKKVGEGRERLERTFSKNAMYVFVIISDQNINKKKFTEIEEAGLKLNNTALFVLLRGIHPNVYGQSRDDTIAKMKQHICNESFKKLDTLIGSLTRN
jgi:hypothetical protein